MRNLWCKLRFEGPASSCAGKAYTLGDAVDMRALIQGAHQVAS